MKPITLTLHVDPATAVRAGKASAGETTITLNEADLGTLTAPQREALAKHIAGSPHWDAPTTTWHEPLDRDAPAIAEATVATLATLLDVRIAREASRDDEAITTLRAESWSEIAKRYDQQQHYHREPIQRLFGSVNLEELAEALGHTDEHRAYVAECKAAAEIAGAKARDEAMERVRRPWSDFHEDNNKRPKWFDGDCEILGFGRYCDGEDLAVKLDRVSDRNAWLAEQERQQAEAERAEAADNAEIGKLLQKLAPECVERFDAGLLPQKELRVALGKLFAAALDHLERMPRGVEVNEIDGDVELSATEFDNLKKVNRALDDLDLPDAISYETTTDMVVLDDGAETTTVPRFTLKADVYGVDVTIRRLL